MKDSLRERRARVQAFVGLKSRTIKTQLAFYQSRDSFPLSLFAPPPPIPLLLFFVNLKFGSGVYDIQNLVAVGRI